MSLRRSTSNSLEKLSIRDEITNFLKGYKEEPNSYAVDSFAFNPYVSDILTKTSGLTKSDHQCKLSAELLTTERTYLSSIHQMLHTYLQPLKIVAGQVGVSSKKEISLADIEELVADVEPIYSITTSMYNVLAERLDRCTSMDDLRIGDIYLDRADDLKCYSNYSIHYEKAIKLLVCCRENKYFRELLKVQAKEHGMELQDLLITPIQRLPRYSMLLEGILKHCDPSHPDSENLTKAAQTVREVTDFVNDSIKSNQKLLEFMEIFRKGKVLKQLMLPGRKFIYMDTLSVLPQVTGSGTLRRKSPTFAKPSVYVLFDDILASCAAVAHTHNPDGSKTVNEAEFSLPLKLTWITEDIKMKVDEDTELQCAELLSPEKSWIINVSSAADKEFLRHIKKAIHALLPPSKAIDETRTDEHRWLGGWYSGDWKNGKPHDKGKWTATSEGKTVVYEGAWDSHLMAGVGVVTHSSKGEVETTKQAWSYSGGVLVETVTDDEVPPMQVEVAERDWKLVLTGHETVSYRKGDVIIAEGTQNTKLYQIHRGTVRVEKMIENAPKVLSKMTPPQMFGEISNCVALIKLYSNDVQLYIVELELVYNLFASNAGLCKRFWRGMATKLADRITSLHHSSLQRKSSASSIDNATNTGATATILKPLHPGKLSDAQLRKRFGLPPTEVIVKGFPCTLERGVRKTGYLYISPKYLCFYSKIFGSVTKRVVAIADIQEIQEGKNKFTLSLPKRTKMTLRLDDNCEEALKILFGLYNSKDQEINKSPVVSSNKSPIGRLRGTTRADTLSEMPSALHPDLVLTHDDWEVLMKSAKRLTFAKDQIIITEGTSHNRLFQIVQGVCRIQKAGSPPMILGRMESGEIFGEISFLQYGPATASILADEACVLYVFEAHYIDILFATEPALAGRFFYYLSGMLSARFEQREKALR